jgi:hypothetical protein
LVNQRLYGQTRLNLDSENESSIADQGKFNICGTR